jgi:hypothetical protein
MMHGHEKSDHAVVAVKPANKTERSAVCGKAARTDLCGGREVTRVPTAKGRFFAAVHESAAGTPEAFEGANKFRSMRCCGLHMLVPS